jgi:nitrate/nitrite transport system ATP-binding protein
MIMEKILSSEKASPEKTNIDKANAERYVQLENVDMTFSTKKGDFNALKNINLSIKEGEFISIIGHSGCGKSTVLNLIAGLTQPTEGLLFCAGREIAGPGPERAVVFQNHSLLPWLSCYENVYLAVERVFGASADESESKAQLKVRTESALELVGLTHATDKRPNEISGGMKQRVGIARALAMEPKVLLLDEPFGALDALTRANLQDELMKIMAKTGCTAVMVTHDVDEAILLSDRVVMMTNGPAAGIGEILNVNLSRPRARLELAEDRDYNHLRSEVLRFLYERHAKKAA